MAKLQENVDLEIWWVLQEIKTLYLLGSKVGNIVFDISESIKEKGAPSPEHQREIIRKLDNLEAIRIHRPIFISPVLDNTPYLEEALGLKPKGFILEVLQPKFDEIYAEFKGIAQKQSDSKPKPSESIPAENNQKVIQAQHEDIEWPPEFQWSDDGKSFLLGDGKELTFGADYSKRKNIFDALAEQMGGWVVVRDIAKAIDESESYVRTVINQLNKKIVDQELQRYILIEPRAMSNKPGAYRLVPSSQSVKHR